MSQLSLQDISYKMREIDICMLTTKTASGQLESRPMSNNREVEYDGDSYFFAYDHCSAAREIAADANVDLSLVHQPTLLGQAFYLSVTGEARLVYDRAELQQHWVKDLDMWFENGLDTPGLVMIHVKARRLKYWQGMDEGVIDL